MNYTSISLYRKLINHALAEGMTKADFKNLRYPLDSLDEIKAVPADDFFALHEQVDQALAPGFSIRVGQEMVLDDYGVLGLSWKTCSTVGEIFERSERYFKLLSDTYVFKVEKNTAISKVFLNRDAYRRGVALSNESTFSATVVVLQAMSESKIRPVEVAFKHHPPKALGSYEQAFQCPILFNQTQNYIAYKTEDLEMRTAKADESINRFLMERVEEEAKGMEVNANKIVTDVSKLIEDALPSGIPSIDQVGEHLGMSSRTLTRRLSENKFTFRDIIRNTQENIAKRLLRNTSSSVGEIAFQTGFSEQSAFNRAFKRWTSVSPLEFRKGI